MCTKLIHKPNEECASVLAKLFGKNSVRRKFDPKVSTQDLKSKAIKKKKPKKITFVLMKDRPTIIPRGNSRIKLKEEGRVKQINISRSMTAHEVKDMLENAFSTFNDVHSSIFMSVDQSNVLKVNKHQEMDGDKL